MIELGISAGPPRVECRNYTERLTAEIEASAESGIVGAALGATEIAAGMYARAFASATVEPVGVRTAAVSPDVLAAVARRLIVGGESVHLIEVEGGAVVPPGGVELVCSRRAARCVALSGDVARTESDTDRMGTGRSGSPLPLCLPSGDALARPSAAGAGRAVGRAGGGAGTRTRPRGRGAGRGADPGADGCE